MEMIQPVQDSDSDDDEEDRRLQEEILTLSF